MSVHDNEIKIQTKDDFDYKNSAVTKLDYTFNSVWAKIRGDLIHSRRTMTFKILLQCMVTSYLLLSSATSGTHVHLPWKRWKFLDFTPLPKGEAVKCDGHKFDDWTCQDR